MLKKAQKIVNQYKELSEQIANPDIINNHNKLAALAKEQSDLESLYQKCKEYYQNHQTYESNQTLLDDEDLEIAEMAKEENEEISIKLAQLDAELKILLIPKDPNDNKDIILEIRA